MAITWGAWEYSGGNGMRVGLEVTWEAVTHGEATATATIDVYTDNQYSYSDSQTLTYGGSLDSNNQGRTSKSFTNNDGASAVLRDTLTYDYDYSSTSYGSSPGTRTFTASLSGAFNGVTPSVSVTSSIPARPYDVPAAPSGLTAAYASDTQANLTWTRNATSGAPYTSQTLEQRVNGGSWTVVTTGISGTATSYTDGNGSNTKYEYRIKAVNSEGSSGYSGTSNAVYTTPAAPSSASRSGANGANQVITWTDNAGYAEHSTEVWVSANDGAYTLLATVNGPNPASTYTHTGPPSASTRWKYKVRHKTTSGTTRYSAFSGETSQTTGASSAPNAPTNLTPTGGVVVNQMTATVLKWQHNPTDMTAQTKYTLQHRVVGSPTWTNTGDITSTASQHTLAANTYPGGTNVEWQVRTYGSSATPSAYSASGTFTTLAVVAYVPMTVDLSTGEVNVANEIQAGTPAGLAATLVINNLGGDVKLFDQATTNPHLVVGGSDARETRLDMNQLRALDGAAVSELYLNFAGGTVIVGGNHNGDVSLTSTNHHLQMGPTSGVNMAVDGNEIQARNAGGANTLGLNLEGGIINLGNNVAGQIINCNGEWRATNVVSGTVAITPSAANTPTSTTVSYSATAGLTYYGYTTPNSTVPGSSVTGTSATSVTATSAVIWLTRANTTATGVNYLILSDQ